MKFKAIDLFCGAGGLSTGLKKSGFRLCLGVDIDEKALKTYKCNLKRTKVLKEDIKKVTGEKITELTGINRRDNFLPVSYTHLDVYKRQGYGSGNVRRKSGCKGTGRICERLPETESDTSGI